jgi:hypothetical protein
MENSSKPKSKIALIYILALIAVILLLVLYFMARSNNKPVATSTPNPTTTAIPTSTPATASIPASNASAAPVASYNTGLSTTLDASLQSIDANINTAGAAIQSANNPPADSDTTP